MLKQVRKETPDLELLRKFIEKLSLDGLLRNVPVPEEQGVGYAVNKYNATHPYKIGGELLSKARWFELTENQRSKDPEHTKLVDRIYFEGKISKDDIFSYQHLSPADFSSPDSPWLSASIICSTNRERLTLTHHAAIRYARAKGKLVYRWPAVHSKWEGAPHSDAGEVFEDPCLYEYFVAGAHGFITDRVCFASNLVNATPVEYHTLSIDDPDDLLVIQSSLPHCVAGDIVTLTCPPFAINVKIDACGKHKDLFTDFQRAYLKTKSIAKDNTIVIPIAPGTTKSTERVLVHGGHSFPPSRLKVSPHFPLELGFAITVNKAQGRTIDNVILALSEKPMKIINMGLKELYVAMSRVTQKANIRLLLNGKNNLDKYCSLDYVDTLEEDFSIRAFFHGYSLGGAGDWQNDQWDEKKALDFFVQHMDKIYGKAGCRKLKHR